jgi:hypothetical protein
VCVCVCVCVTILAGLVWIWARCLLSPYEHGKDREASRTGGNILASKTTVGLSRRYSVGGDRQLIVGDCMEMCLSNWGNSSHVDTLLLLSVYKY